jgi:hypothetical protein
VVVSHALTVRALLAAALLAAAMVLGMARAEAAPDDLLLLLDPTRLTPAVASRGAGPDGRWVRPRAVAAACARDGVHGPAAFSPSLDRCRNAAAVPGLAEAVLGLVVQGEDMNRSALEHVAAGGIVAVVPRLRLACIPGNCDRQLFEDAAYPTALVNRPLPPPLPEPRILEFSVVPDALVAGQSAELRWTVDSVDQCLLSSSASTARGQVAAAGTRSVTPLEDTVWTLTCAAPGGSASAQVSASVTPPSGAPRILMFEATRADVPIGARTTLVLEALDADGCTLNDGQATLSVGPRARVTVRIEEPTVFLAVCDSASGSAVATTEVAATAESGPPVFERFELDRSSIERGDPVGLYWQATGATQCRLRDAGQGTIWRLPPAGSRTLSKHHEVLLRQEIVGPDVFEIQGLHFCDGLSLGHLVQRFDRNERVFAAVFDQHQPAAGPQGVGHGTAHFVGVGELVIGIDEQDQIDAARR